MHLCVICEKTATGGTLSLVAEVRGQNGNWPEVARIGEFALCDTDYERMVSVATAMVYPAVGNATALGVPMRQSALNLGPGHCDSCQAALADTATGVELVPATLTYRRGMRSHRTGAIRRLRVCRQCAGWWLAVTHDPSSILGTSERRCEGTMGGWLKVSHGPGAWFGLRPRDRHILEVTFEADHHELRHISGPTGLRADEVVFVAAGKRDRATKFVKGMSPFERHRIAVVAEADQLADAREALKLGAGEILASPLSPQQVVFAANRGLTPRSDRRDGKTGLFILPPPAPDYGRSCYAVQLHPRGDHSALEVALMARRFIRGYDEVGADGNGRLCLRIYCGDEEIQGIEERLQVLMGRMCTLQRTASAKAA